MKAQDFIAKIVPAAEEGWRSEGISAALTIAQAALESNWGSSGLALQGNNLFGMKGKGTAGSIIMPTLEYRAGKPIKVNASFRKYWSWSDSVADHRRLLMQPRYSAVARKSGKEAAKAVAAAGYATDPGYASKLIAMMDKYNLYQYDRKEGDEPMTAEEKRQFQALQDLVTAQGQRIAELEKRDNMDSPQWAKEAIAAAGQYSPNQPLINMPEKGSYHFYRIITILHRLGLFNKTKAG